ncbi:uncharacterized protein LOC143018745 [Oratosquilla oratoria]|uniref:uncharacterized protein LOC143018745 n=1 Tax=Oratosquilla oratoria TaxID=337810 RepID=UPI003F763E30
MPDLCKRFADSTEEYCPTNSAEERWNHIRGIIYNSAMDTFASCDTITDRGKQMERWAKHYQELYSRKNVVSTAAVENSKVLPLMEELDAPPSTDELRKAIDFLASGKAPGNDGIPPEVVKAGKSTALHHHHKLLLQCW